MSQFLYVFDLTIEKARQGEAIAKQQLKELFAEQAKQIAANAGSDGALSRLLDEHSQAISTLMEGL